MKSKNEQKAAVNDGSVAGMFLGLLIGLFVPNVLIMAGLSDDVIIFMSLITVIAGIVWSNDNLPAKNVDDAKTETFLSGGVAAGDLCYLDPTDNKLKRSVNRSFDDVTDEEFEIGRTVNPWLGDVIERAADQWQGPDCETQYTADEVDYPVEVPGPGNVLSETIMTALAHRYYKDRDSRVAAINGISIHDVRKMSLGEKLMILSKNELCSEE
ncbi:hypothetical protein KAR91_40530 [Candidatus Pacearchaeota archaeon]|nr:hypothetical protein [Candidatus Pacearchaeota archaeon]